MKRVIKLAKVAGRALNDDKIRQQIDTIVASVNTAGRMQRGWAVGVVKPTAYRYHSVDYNSTYRVTLEVTCSKERASNEQEFANIVNAINTRGNASHWDVESIDGEPYKKQTLAVQQQENSDIGYAPIEIPGDWDSYFNHLYGLDAHINRIRRALDAAVFSGWRHRFHCALIGPPGCGKSDICQSIKKALGEDSVLEFDATATTMAGAQKELAERDDLPRILLVEEIEKAPESSMAWLLSVLDLRGEIRKTTARGNVLRDARMLAIATVNDLPTFQKVNFGALESRFSNKVFFNRPSRELLGRILTREVERVNGDVRWVAPALDYAEAINTTDPREVIAIALCGREALLTGEYQRDMRATSNNPRENKAMIDAVFSKLARQTLLDVEQSDADFEERS